jgi:hypothetical protein
LTSSSSRMSACCAISSRTRTRPSSSADRVPRRVHSDPLCECCQHRPPLWTRHSAQLSRVDVLGARRCTFPIE